MREYLVITTGARRAGSAGSSGLYSMVVTAKNETAAIEAVLGAWGPGRHEPVAIGFGSTDTEAQRFQALKRIKPETTYRIEGNFIKAEELL